MKYRIYITSKNGGRTLAHKVNEEMFEKIKNTVSDGSDSQELYSLISSYDIYEWAELEREWIGDGVSCFVANDNNDGVISIDVDAIELRQLSSSDGQQPVPRYGEGLWREEEVLFDRYSSWIFSLEINKEGFDPRKLFFKKSNYTEEELNNYKYADALSYEDGIIELVDSSFGGSYTDRLLAVRDGKVTLFDLFAWEEGELVVANLGVDELEKVQDLLAVSQTDTIIPEPSVSSSEANHLKQKTSNNEKDIKNNEALTVYDECDCFFGDLAKVGKEGMYGFIDKTGKIAVPLDYDDAGVFSENGLAWVKKDGKCGCIDTSGKIVVPLQYDEVHGFREGLALVRKDDLYGFIDENGKLAVPLEYDDAGEYFSKGLAQVKRDGRWGVVDKSGKVVFPFEYDGWIDYNDCLLMQKKSKCSIVNKTKKTIAVVNCGYGYGDGRSLFFREGLALVQNFGLHGFIDIDGKETIPLEYDEANHFSEGLAIVSEGLDGLDKTRKWGCIDKTGKMVIPFELEYESFGYFSEGIAVVKKDGKWGCIDKTGKVVVPVKYDKVLRFNGGWSAVRKDGKWGCIDKSGKVVVPLDLGYDSVNCFSEGMSVVKKNGKYGCIDESGKVVIPMEYDSIGCFSEGISVVKKDGKWGCIDKTGKVLVPLKYNERFQFNEGLAQVSEDGKWLFLDKAGNVILSLEKRVTEPASVEKEVSSKDNICDDSEEDYFQEEEDSEGITYERITIEGSAFIESSVGKLSDDWIERIKSRTPEKSPGQSSITFTQLAQDNDDICHDFFFEEIEGISISKMECTTKIKIPFVESEDDYEIESIDEICFDDFEENGITIDEEASEKITEGNIVLHNPDNWAHYYWDDDRVDLSKLKITKCVKTYPDGSEIEGYVVKYKGEQAISPSEWKYPEVNILVDGEWNDYAWDRTLNYE